MAGAAAGNTTTIPPEVHVLVSRAPKPPTCAIPIVDEMRKRVLENGGRFGFRSMAALLKRFDRDGNRQLSKDELRDGLAGWGLRTTPFEMDTLMRHFDRDKSGQITVDEFVKGIRTELSPKRRDLVLQAHRQLDRNLDGRVTVTELVELYDASGHPDVLSGRRTVEEATAEFASGWLLDEDQVVTLDEFVDYYTDIGSGIDNDEYFELLVRNVWHLGGGKGASANTTCMRVRVLHKDGRETSEVVKNDIGIARMDVSTLEREQIIIQRLKQQGIIDAVRIVGVL